MIASDGARTTYRVYASEQRGSDSKENRLLAFNVDVNRPHLTSAEGLLVNDGSKSSFFGPRGGPKEILHPAGEVNKIRECPLHPQLVATHSDCPEVFVWNMDRQPEATQPGAGVPDLTLTGHKVNRREIASMEYVPLIRRY